MANALLYARMKLTLTLIAAAALMTSCSWLKRMVEPGEYSPAYMQEESALDPPGAQQAREEARRKLVKDGLFVPGAEIEVREGKAFLFSRNPDHVPDTGGRMVKSAKAKILSCEGTYYFVEVDGGKRGFLRESDFVDPVSMLTTTPGYVPDGQGILPAGDPSDGGSVLPDGTLDIGDNKTLTTNENGRTVVVVGKRTDKTQQFEEERRRIEAGATPSEDTPLPEPAASH